MAAGSILKKNGSEHDRLPPRSHPVEATLAMLWLDKCHGHNNNQQQGFAKMVDGQFNFLFTHHPDCTHAVALGQKLPSIASALRHFK